MDSDEPPNWRDRMPFIGQQVPPPEYGGEVRHKGPDVSVQLGHRCTRDRAAISVGERVDVVMETGSASRCGTAAAGNCGSPNVEGAGQRSSGSCLFAPRAMTPYKRRTEYSSLADTKGGFAIGRTIAHRTSATD